MREYKIDEFVRVCFRDVADKDYIAARVCYRHGLLLQFLWLSLQALEKYLKAILLYHRIDTRWLQHRLVRAFERLSDISDIAWDFPPDILPFLKNLDEEGPNRYLEYPAQTEGRELLQLDRAVWYIRRYCFNFRRSSQLRTGETVDQSQAHIGRIQGERTLTHPHKYRISGGLLERVIEDRKSELRPLLVWMNFYYGAHKKHKLRRFKLRMSVSKPTHFVFPEVFDDVAELAYFSKRVKDYFRTRTMAQAESDE